MRLDHNPCYEQLFSDASNVTGLTLNLTLGANHTIMDLRVKPRVRPDGMLVVRTSDTDRLPPIRLQPRCKLPFHTSMLCNVLDRYAEVPDPPVKWLDGQNSNTWHEGRSASPIHDTPIIRRTHNPRWHPLSPFFCISRLCMNEAR